MRNVNLWLSIKKIAVLVSVLFFGLVVFSPGASANGYRYYGEGGPYNTAMEERALLDRVYATNAGWDWQPRCAGGARWSWHDCRCKGGTGDNHDHGRHHHHHD